MSGIKELKKGFEPSDTKAKSKAEPEVWVKRFTFINELLPIGVLMRDLPNFVSAGT